ncbi:MAG: carbohydrate ABC transporter permease [Anaerolineae bacterium]
MSTPAVHEDKRPATQTPSQRQSRYIISVILMMIGLGAIVVFVLSVLQDSGIQFVMNWAPSEEFPTQPSLLLVFLERFGIITSLLVLYLGIFFIVIGLRLPGGEIQNAQWAKIAFMWLSIGLIVYIILNSVNLIRLSSDEDAIITTMMIIMQIVVPLIGVIVTGGVWLWLNAHLNTHFIGEDRLLARETRLAWNLLIPTLAIFIIVSARPLEQTFIRSLTDKRFAGSEVPQFVGLQNYTNLLSFRIDTVPCRTDDESDACSIRANGSIRWESIDRNLLSEGYRTVWNVRIGGRHSLAISGLDNDFLRSILTTLQFSIVSVSLELLIGLFMALVVNSNFKGRGMMRAVMLVPWAIPTVISARLWELMLKDTSAGIVNKILMDLNLIASPQAWLSDPSLQLPTAIIVDVWKTAPFMALLLLAGLQTIPKDLYEAASVDGASPLRRFFSITLPLLRPAIAIALVFRTLDALRVFDLFNVLFGRQQLSMATYNFETLVNNQLDGYASAVSVIIFIFISIFAFIYVRMLNVETDNE